MDQLKWTTPSKMDNRENFKTNSPRMSTPVKQNQMKFKHTSNQNNSSCFSVLPSHITPPSGLTKFIARNPFESDLTNRLHLSVMSPTVFSKVSSPSQCSPGFAWSVEELALMHPAKIEEFPTQQAHSTDPEAEEKAQEAIDKFFMENEIIPSPWEVKKKENRLKNKISTPKSALINVNSGSEFSKSKKDGWSQTVLSLPPELPPHIEEVLKPFLTFTQEQNVDNEDANSSNNSLRRKLFFNHDDCLDNDEDSSIHLSPMKMNGSMVLSCSPPQSGMFIHGTPLKCPQEAQRTQTTPGSIPDNLSPPDISPIHSTINMSCESLRSKSRSVARLDFSFDVSVDRSAVKIKESTAKQISGGPTSKEDIQYSEENVNHPPRFHTKVTCVTSRNASVAEIMPKNSTLFENDTKSESGAFKHYNIFQKFKFLTDSCKIYDNESCLLQQTNMLFGISDQQSVSNSVQDTGYQTYSMCSTANAIDSCNITPVKQKINLEEKMVSVEDEVQLSDWKENVKNIFSSTLSRNNKEKDNHRL